jgi:hypothetical protein
MNEEIKEEVIHSIPAIIMMLGTWVAAGIITYVVSYFDVIVHTNYVLPISAFCWGSNPVSPQGNTDPFCIMEYKVLGLQQGDQAHIGSPYWNLLAVFMYFIASAITVMRITMSLVIRKIKEVEFTWVTTYTWLATFITIISLLSASWGDGLYYWIQGQSVPATMPWDNNIFYFPFILQNITHDPNVTSFDLYLSMFFGAMVAITVWIPLWFAYAKHERSAIELL